MHDALALRGGGVLAVSVDPPELAARMAAELELGFPLLCDTGRTVLRRYGLLHEGAAPGGASTAIPAALLLDRGRRVVAAHVADRIPVRAPPELWLDAIGRRWPRE